METILKRDRAIVIAGLVVVIVLSWIYILNGAGMGMTAFEMTTMSESAAVPMESSGITPMEEMAPMENMEQKSSMSHESMMKLAVWSPGYAFLMFFMWWIMMVAMMLPSASPMILLFAMIQRQKGPVGTPFVPTGGFAGGYLVAWGLFSMLATILQWGMEFTGFLSSMMISTNILLGSGLLIGAGIYCDWNGSRCACVAAGVCRAAYQRNPTANLHEAGRG